MSILGIYLIGCLVGLVVVVLVLLNEYFHHQDVTISCIVSCFFLVMMSWSSILVALWVLAMKVLEFFKIEDKVAIKGKKND